MRMTAATVTLGLAGCLALTAIGISPAAPVHPAKGAKTNAAMIARGKTLASSLRPPCTGCHGADLAGRSHFAPSLHAGGVLREYTPATWARVMNTGLDNDGHMVRKPMPVYHMKAADSNALYAYFKTLK